MSLNILPPPDARHSHESRLREKLIEHLFEGEILRALWRQERRGITVLHPEVDDGGFDVVLECEGTVRHVQLKSSRRDARTAAVNIHTRLAGRPGGCVVWIFFDEDLRLGPYRWFGPSPGEPLPSLGEKIARHTKANSQGYKAFKPNFREVSRGRFVEVQTIEELASKLFGAPLVR